MTIQSGQSLYSQNSGISFENVQIPEVPIPARSPTAQDVGYPIGKRWINTALNIEYCLTSESSIGGTLLATWVISNSAAGSLNTITTQDSSVVTPAGGNVFLSGAPNQLTTTGSGATATVGFVNAVTFPGSAATTTSLTVGTKLHVATGANASIGTATLVAGTVTVATTAIAAGSKVFLSYNTLGGAQGIINAPVGSYTAGVSFVINSNNPADTSTINWWIIN